MLDLSTSSTHLPTVLPLNPRASTPLQSESSRTIEAQAFAREEGWRSPRASWWRMEEWDPSEGMPRRRGLLLEGEKGREREKGREGKSVSWESALLNCRDKVNEQKTRA